ncbi:hypothetical protein MY4824_008997 [Beauveria thailandica]
MTCICSAFGLRENASPIGDPSMESYIFFVTPRTAAIERDHAPADAVARGFGFVFASIA